MASREEVKQAIKEVMQEEKQSWIDSLISATGLTKKKKASDIGEDDLKETVASMIAEALTKANPPKKSSWL